MEDLDLSEFHGVFFDEAADHLTGMESLLLAIDVEAADDEQLNAIFRAAHSIKGGAGAFGFTEIAELTHEVETVFDRVRKKTMPLSSRAVDVFLASADMLKAMFAARKDGAGGVPDEDVARLCDLLRAFRDAPALVPTRSAALDSVFGPFEADAVDPAVADPVAPARQPVAAAPIVDAASIRVSTQKIDALIQLVGELVITEAMLAQAAMHLDSVPFASLSKGLVQLRRTTRNLHESAMAIRMMPMSVAFGRFPRLVRDLAASLNKQIELQTEGESTELDKGRIERIIDPLMHLVRNSVDHGIESPAAREAAGKPVKGTITLRAFHRGGNVVVEVLDDGTGLDRERLLKKARERGKDVSDAMTDEQVFALIFEPGFSTAETITDVSGRGVGMDIVRRNIREMGGNVAISSALGVGTRISIHLPLPLPLAAVDGLSVAAGNEVVIIPLTSIVESLQPATADVKTITRQGRVVQVREAPVDRY